MSELSLDRQERDPLLILSMERFKMFKKKILGGGCPYGISHVAIGWKL